MRRRRMSAPILLLPLLLPLLLSFALPKSADAAHKGTHRVGRQQSEELQITVYPAELSVREGREASFECRARAADNSVYPEVRWTRVGGRLPDGVHESAGRLTIPHTQLHHSGRYACIAMHRGRTVEAYATLNVQSYGPQELQGDTNAVAAGCMADERACGSNECVKLEYVCDGEPDCRDRSDEQNCPSKRHCEPNEFRCRNDKCVQKMWLCDGDDDCGDRSDEESCGQRKPGDMCQPTEFRCADGRQCVPQSFQCDGTNDCQDGSDEIGCVQPTVVQPPESNVAVSQGQDFKLTCRAVGVPDPYINWRLNWADVCEPPRCQQASEGGVGTLTVQNAQPMDQGAYTCEAINVKGRVLATPDCIVRIVSIPAPQAPPPPPPPPPQPEPQRLTCNAQGAYSPYTDTRGRCQCKPMTTGTTCGQCAQGAYHLSDQAPQGCLKCFCFGITDQCRSSSWFRTKEKLFFSGDSQGIELSDVQGNVQPGVQFDYEQYGFLTHKEPHFSQTLYWKLPQRFLGNKVTAYGGDMSLQLQYQGSGSIRDQPLVVIKGNRITLVHKPRDQESLFTPGQPFTINVNTYEQNFEHQNGAPASREDLMMVLADLDMVLIRASHTDDQTSTSLGDSSWEIAVARDTQDERALEVEQCECPPGYTGTSCEDCAEGYERSGQGPYLGYCVPARRPPPPAPSPCDQVGALTAMPQYDGRCECKQNVVGATCNRCAPESFHLAPQNPGGCLRCFCSGVTHVCESTHWRRSRVELDYARGDREQLDAITSDARNPYKPPTQPQVYDGAINFNGFYEARGQTLYWNLPPKFLGDKVTSYGGKLRYTFRFSGAGSLNPDADVIIRGNNIQLEYVNRQQVQPDRDNVVEVPITELGWHHSNGASATREQLLMALADLDALQIKMSYMSDCSQASLVSVSLDTADAYGQGETALDVEQCQCPPGYVGTSCEDCAPGYSRTGGGPYLGLCEKCECHNHASQCDAEYGACLDCQHNTEGDRCERCKPGFVGDARRGTPYDCQPAREIEVARPHCQCYLHSPRGCDSYGRCILCEHNTEGFHCELCKKGYYGDATKGTPWDCTPCPCPGASDCYLDASGQVQCRNCPAGFAGRLCDQCAPGYTRSQISGGRECEPIGEHLPAKVKFVPEPDAQSITTAAGPGLQLGEFVDVEVGGRTEEKEEEKEEGEKEEEGPLVEVEGPEANGRGERPIGVVDPDRMLRTEEGKRAEEEEEEAEEAEQREPDLQPQRARQFSGTTAVALPPGRAQELGSLNLEVQVRPRFPDGVILYAAGSDPSRHPKQTPPLMHSLELTNRTVQYSFALGGEHFEILQSREPIRLDEWTIIRVINDGKGRASLQVGSSRPSELFYTPSRLTIPLANIPSRIFLGGPDPARAKYMPKTTNFVGSIGRLMMNGQEMEVVTASTEAEGGQGHYRKAEKQESRLDQSENQCSREPCRNGGQCRLTRWGGFECHCVPGFAGHLCQLPSTDGICPGGRRWCHRGICSFRGRKGDQAQCLCPPGWEGDRCGSEIDLESAPKGIRLDGANSFLALPLGAGVEEGEQTPRVYSIELRLSPDPDRRGHEQQQLVGLMVGAQGRVISALGMQGEKFWAVQQETDDQPATKRFLTKRIKHKKTHRLRLEQGEQAGEMRLLVEGHPKGVLRGEPGPDGILVLGGMPPRGMELPRAMAADTLLEGVPPFAGCVEELRLNGRVLGMEELRRDGYSGAGLDSCEAGEPQQKMPRTTAKPREDTAALWTTTSPPPPPPTRPAPTTPLPIFMVSQDPILANQRGRETPMVGPIGVIDEKEEEEWRRRPPADALSPDQIPTQLHQSVRTTSVPAPPPFTTTERPPDPTTAVPAPPRPVFRHRPDSFVPPNFAAFPDSAELEGPFAGLCDAWTCGGHGTCEELNGTHVLCACRDYYVGQRCGEFRPIEYAAKFDGTAFVVFSSDEFPHLSSEREEMVEFKLRTRAKYGLIIWQGQQPNVEEPEPTADAFGAEDFLSIGLLDGYLSFSYELGGGAAQLLSEIPVDDGKTHTVRAVRRGRDGWLFVDNEQPVGGRSSGILAMLNVEGHIFVGGVPDLHQMTSGLHTQNLVGCVAELALNGHKMDLMGSAIDGRNVRPCRSWEPNRMRRRRKWMRLMRKQRKTAQQRRRKKALAGE